MSATPTTPSPWPYSSPRPSPLGPATPSSPGCACQARPGDSPHNQRWSLALHARGPHPPHPRPIPPRPPWPHPDLLVQTRAPFAATSSTSRRSRRKPVRARSLPWPRALACAARGPPPSAPSPALHPGLPASIPPPVSRPARPRARRRCRLLDCVGLLRPRLPPGLHLALAQDPLGLPALQPRVGVRQDREDRDLRQPRLKRRRARTCMRGSGSGVDGGWRAGRWRAA